MSALGDRIVRDGPVRAGDPAIAPSAVEWNALRDELIELRGIAARYEPTAVACGNAEQLSAVAAELDRQRLRWAPGEWRGCAPAGLAEVTFHTENEPPMPGPPVTRVDPRNLDTVRTEAAGALSCLICGGPVGVGMFECTRCSGLDEAAAKRRADQ